MRNARSSAGLSHHHHFFTTQLINATITINIQLEMWANACNVMVALPNIGSWGGGSEAERAPPHQLQRTWWRAVSSVSGVWVGDPAVQRFLNDRYK